MFADLDGMVFIPEEIEMEVIQEAAKRVEVENEIRSKLDAGASMREMWDKYHVL